MPKNIFVLTGAGISAESGVGTFRDKRGEGIWAKFDPMKLATPEAFARDPEALLAFYDQRRRNLLNAKPNGAHFALARLEGTLAERGGMSKQAMNQLLRSLEDLGYVIRSDASDEGRARIVRFTKRGRAAYSKVHDILRDIEHEWSAELGPKDFAQLKKLLSRVWESPLTR